MPSGFRVADENSKKREYFCCSTRDEMAKWMNKMGLAAINFNIDDSKIGGFHKGFVDFREESPTSTPNTGTSPSSGNKQEQMGPIGSAGDSENDSDKESTGSWHKSTSYHSSISDTESLRDKVNRCRAKQEILDVPNRKFCFYRTISELIYHLLLVMHIRHHRLQSNLIFIIVQLYRHPIVLSVR